MLKLAECRMRLKQPAEARALLARLVNSFPGTPAATEAQARLARIPRTP
jgi:TolA-binding protein